MSMPTIVYDTFDDPRFNKEVDNKTGYRTHSICCMPILNRDNVVIGVAQIINKKTGTHEFTSKDINVFRNYLTFCGLGLSNAQLFELSIQEYKKNQVNFISYSFIICYVVVTTKKKEI
ncbi:unnamed protein product [Adineta steineri]|uniref:GAF domain-containing protein n=1 Tax=Adineta steineri TaxID=433720 RepID=A0A815G8M3_9BILA|nr:unnamed protein product [Adineta steineri]